MNARKRSRAPVSLQDVDIPQGFAWRSWTWLWDHVARTWHWLARTSRLAIGIPDYAVYCDHMRDHHGSDVPLTRDAFFRDRLQARYGRGSSRCC